MLGNIARKGCALGLVEASANVLHSRHVGQIELCELDLPHFGRAPEQRSYEQQDTSKHARSPSQQAVQEHGATASLGQAQSVGKI